MKETGILVRSFENPLKETDLGMVYIVVNFRVILNI